jgi:hypothetical protein
MIDEDKICFGELMSGLAELYGKKLTPALLEIYWQTLAEYSYANINQAINAHILNPDSGQFMPKPADIVRFVKGATQTSALRAWSKVINALREVGVYQSIVFDDPIIHMVIEEMDGWIALGHVKEDKLSFVTHEFQKRYVSYLAHEPTVYPAKLIGIFEQQNGFTGFGHKALIFYGSKELARYVHKTGVKNSNVKNIHEVLLIDQNEAKPSDKKSIIKLDWQN